MTLDHISNGRLELGLGAGWYEPEHAMFGLEFPEPPELVARFSEAVEIVDSLLRNDTTSFEGRHYQLQDAPMRPLGIQQPRPPLMLGAHKSRMLRIVAQYADTWNSFGTPDEMRERNAMLDEHCAAIGRDPSTIVRSLYGWAALMPGRPVGQRRRLRRHGRAVSAGRRRRVPDRPAATRATGRARTRRE